MFLFARLLFSQHCMALVQGVLGAPFSCMKGTDLSRNGIYQPTIPFSDYLRGKCRVVDFENIKQLGAGVAGVVNLARHKPSQRLVAVKKIYAGDSNMFHKFRAEECTQHALNGSPYTMQHYCTVVDDSNVYFVMEFVEGVTELRPQLRDGKNARKFSDHQLKSFALQLIESTAQILERGVIHGDLKSANVLLTRDDRLKIIDFGLARFVQDAGSNFKQKPDLDWFLLGVHLFELFTRGKVFREVYPKGSGEKWKSLRISLKCPTGIKADECDLVRSLVLSGSGFWKLRSISGRSEFLRTHPYFK